jgi:hypothetical protein
VLWSGEVLQKLNEAELYFGNTKYKKIVREASRQFHKGEMGLCLVHLGRLPSDGELLAELVNKLKGKSVYKTLERSKKVNDKFTDMKGLSSLFTHCIIECQQGHLEYQKLIPLLLDKLNDLSYSFLSR